jgi:hypothetical protein
VIKLLNCVLSRFGYAVVPRHSLAGQYLPEPAWVTATGRCLYTSGQMRDFYNSAVVNSRSLLVRSRNLLTHPEAWIQNSPARDRIVLELSKHIANLHGQDSPVQKYKR